jgi:hypothetical protein
MRSSVADSVNAHRSMIGAAAKLHKIQLSIARWNILFISDAYWKEFQMRTVIAFAIFGLLTGSLVIQSAYFAVIGLAMGALSGFGIGICIAGHVRMRQVNLGTVTLVAMRRLDCLEGTFLLGSGSIHSQSSYSFLQLQDDGSVVPRSVPVNRLVHLTEDPQLQNIGYWSTIWEEVDSTHWLSKWACGASERNRIVRQDFRVPRGTILHQFTI